MADNQYITIMLQSLQKKEKVLNSIIQINKRQKEELENPSLDPDDFDKTVEEKSELIEQLELLALRNCMKKYVKNCRRIRKFIRMRFLRCKAVYAR